jgi:hypothetical protein
MVPSTTLSFVLTRFAKEELKLGKNNLSGDVPNEITNLASLGECGDTWSSRNHLCWLIHFRFSEILSLSENFVGPDLPVDLVKLSNLRKSIIRSIASDRLKKRLIVLISSLFAHCVFLLGVLDLSSTFVAAFPGELVNDLNSIGLNSLGKF